jgi:hypothetical protein
MTKRTLGLLVISLAGCTGGVELEQLPEEYGATLCGIVADCLPNDVAAITPFSESTCQNDFAGGVRSSLDSIELQIERGTITYDGAAARACLDQTRALGCDTFIVATPEVCRNIFIGNVEVGGDCSTNEECAGDAYCRAANCPDQAGTCTATETMGGPCAGDAECSAGLVCEDAVCRTSSSRSGGECGGGSGLDCPLDETCVGDTETERGTCTPWASVRTQSEGEGCDPTDDELCMEGLSCVVTAAVPALTFECRARVGAGEECHIGIPNHCPDTHFCDVPALMFMGTCEPLPEEGEPCAMAMFSRNCAAGLACNMGTMQCVVLQDNGGSCDNGADCYSGNCESGMCEADELCSP